MVGVLYWVLVGFLALFALYVSVAGYGLWWGFSIPAALALFGAWWPGLRYAGAGLVLFGAYPALLLTGGVLNRIANPMRACSEVTMGGVPRPPGSTHECDPTLTDMIAGVGLWAVALLGVVLLVRQARHGDL